MEQKALTQFKDLTLKQKKFLKVYIETGNATEAAFQAYDCKSRDVARALGTEVLAKLSTAELMEEMGLTKQGLMKIVAAGITKPTRKVLKKSKKYVVYHPNKTHEVTDKNGKKTIVSNFEEVTEMEYEDVPDYQVRHRFVETALKLNKSIDNSGEKVDIENLTFIFGAPTNK